MERGKGLLLAGAVLGVMVALEAGFRDAWRENSAQVTVAIQQTANGVTNWGFTWGDKVSWWLVLLIPLYCLSFEGLKTGLPLLATACISSGLSNIVKLTYADERPFWAYGSILAIYCSKGFGTPSGHCLLTGAVYSLFAYYSYKHGRRTLAWVLFPALFFVGYTQLFLGVHSYDQVLLSWAIAGVVLSTVLHLKLTKGRNLPTVLLCSHLLTLSTVLYCVVLYTYSQPDWDQDWSLYLYEVGGMLEV